jgi:hypothetical protein
LRLDPTDAIRPGDEVTIAFISWKPE